MIFLLRHPVLTIRAIISLWRDPPGATFVVPVPPDEWFEEQRRADLMGDSDG